MWVHAIFANPVIRWRTDQAFFIAMGLAIIAENVIGFTLSFLRTDIADELHSDWVKVHTLAFASWLVLYLTQSILIASDRKDIHRYVGIFGTALAGLMVGLTIGSGVSSFLQSPPRWVAEHFMLHVAVHIDMFIFTGFVIAGVLLRDVPETHKRLMLLATIAVGLRFPPLALQALFHVSWPHYYEQMAYVLAAIAYDLISRGRVNRALIWGILIYATLPISVEWAFKIIVPHLMVRPEL